MIEKPEWWQLCENPELRQSFQKMSRSFTHCPEFQEDLRQEAWLRIGEYLAQNPGGKTLEFYKKLGHKAMHAYRMREWRHQKKFKPWIGSASYQRVRRTLKKQKKFKVVKKKQPYRVTIG